ncbi:carbohydrate-binding protein [Chitinibacteraceae bacterium HSL-7]
MKMRTLAVALSLSAAFHAASALATCQPPPPTATFNMTALPESEQALGFIPPLTYAPSPYSCPYSVMLPDGTWQHEMRVAYYTVTARNESITHALSDAEMQAAGLDAVTSQLPQWDAAAVYQAGTKVQWQGHEYRALWWTLGEAPGQPAGAWAAIPQSGLVSWQDSQAYQAGDKAVYGGAVWRARWWTKNEVPGATEWGAWERTADALPPARPGVFSVRLMPDGAPSPTSNMQVTVMSAVADEAAPAYIEVRENGKPIARLTDFAVTTIQCGEMLDCHAGVYWQAGAVVPIGGWSYAPGNLYYGSYAFPTIQSGYFSLSACNAAGQCRPTQVTALVSGLVGSEHVSEPFPLFR